MRNGMWLSVVVVFALSLMLAGTILAQDDTDSSTGAAWLGISFSETDEGVTVERVAAGSPAETAGLQAGDVIVSVDGAAVESADGLAELVASHAAGDVIEVVVSRGGEEQTLEATLGAAPVHGRGWQQGLALGDVDPLVAAEMVLHVDLDSVDGGYQVLAGRMRAGTTLEVGDVITTVNDTPIASVDWTTLADDLAVSDNPVLTLGVQRGGEAITVDYTWMGFGGHGRLGEPGDADDGFRGHGREGFGARGGFDGQPGQGTQSDGATSDVPLLDTVNPDGVATSTGA